MPPATPPAQHPSVGTPSTRRLLMTLGAAMVAGGAPVYDVEDELRRVAWVLGHRQVQVSASPTSVLVSLTPGDAASLQVVPAPLRLDQSALVNDIRRRLLAGEYGVGRALSELARLHDQRARFGWSGAYVGNVAVAAGICLIMQPGLGNLALVVALSVVVTALLRLAPRHALITLLPTVATFVVAAAVFGAYQAGWLEGPLRTLICPVAVLLPGAQLATGMAELAGGMMVSGTSRLVYGATQLLLATLGVVAAALLLQQPFETLSNVRVGDLGWWAAPAGLTLISLGLVLAESLPLRLMPYALAILVTTYLAQHLGQTYSGTPGLGTFVGALAASFGASALEATRPNVPRLVVFLPSFWLLVPGTLGLMGITRLGTAQAGAADLVGVVTILVTIALGLLVGSALARPLHRLARRYRRTRIVAPDSGAPVAVPTTDAAAGSSS